MCITRILLESPPPPHKTGTRISVQWIPAPQPLSVSQQRQPLSAGKPDGVSGGSGGSGGSGIVLRRTWVDVSEAARCQNCGHHRYWWDCMYIFLGAQGVAAAALSALSRRHPACSVLQSECGMHTGRGVAALLGDHVPPGAAGAGHILAGRDRTSGCAVRHA